MLPEIDLSELLAHYPLARAIAAGWVDDYRLAVIGIRRAEALRYLRATAPTIAAGPTEPALRNAVVQAALAQAVRRFGLRRAPQRLPEHRAGRVRDLRVQRRRLGVA
ncbi:hypothetical protein ACPZ19_46145 [Amycolatopsis lurida]